jgi:hypothetical protein
MTWRAPRAYPEPTNVNLITRRQLVRSAGALAAVSAFGPGILSACGIPQLGVRPRRIGYMSIGPREAFATSHDAFIDELRSLGYAERRSVEVEWRADEGDTADWSHIAEELIALPVDIFVINGSTPAGKLTLQHTSSFRLSPTTSTIRSKLDWWRIWPNQVAMSRRFRIT